MRQLCCEGICKLKGDLSRGYCGDFFANVAKLFFLPHTRGFVHLFKSPFYLDWSEFITLS